MENIHYYMPYFGHIKVGVECYFMRQGTEYY